MLSVKVLVRQNISKVAEYYEDGADDYYAKEGEAALWAGEGALRLGLTGAVEGERFKELLSGHIAPDIYVTRFSTRDDCKTRIGIDLTFSAPKSVSMQALIGRDSAIIKAHDLAVQKTIEIAQTRAQARQKINKKSFVEDTGNLIVAKFRHETSREQDPQLHTHAVVMNLTQRKDGQWRALKNDEIIKMTKYLGATYRAYLAEELQKLGYGLRHERDGLFELAHISRQQLKAFSARGLQIEEELATQGLSRNTASAQKKQQITLATREKKQCIDREALYRTWCDKAHELGINFIDRAKTMGDVQPDLVSYTSVMSQLAAARSLRYAINHLTERQAVIDERALIDVALKHSVGMAGLSYIEQALNEQVAKGFLIKEKSLYKVAEDFSAAPGKSREALVNELCHQGIARGRAKQLIDNGIKTGRFIRSDVRYTTQTALEREKRILQIEREGRGAVSPIYTKEDVLSHLKTAALNQGQREAVEMITTSENRVIGVQGYAGTGKSHMLKTAISLVEKKQYFVQALAPYGSQVKALQTLGVRAKTVASFLKARENDLCENTVLVIDEAGVIPSRLMERVLREAEAAGARVILLGDTAQTKAVEAGKPFEQLQAAGMATAKMDEILRQDNQALRKAATLAAKGEVSESLKYVPTIIEIQDAHQRRDRVASEYVALAKELREDTLIVSGTNEARREINELVRKKSGLEGSGIVCDLLIRRDTTQAERRFAKHYRIGDVIQPEKEYPSIGLQRGEIYRITDTTRGPVTILVKNRKWSNFGQIKRFLPVQL